MQYSVFSCSELNKFIGQFKCVGKKICPENVHFCPVFRKICPKTKRAQFLEKFTQFSKIAQYMQSSYSWVDALVILYKPVQNIASLWTE